MNDKEIKRKLKDASLWFLDASKRWPSDKEVARNNFRGGLAIIDVLYDYVERPLGGEEE